MLQKEYDRLRERAIALIMGAWHIGFADADREHYLIHQIIEDKSKSDDEWFDSLEIMSNE